MWPFPNKNPEPTPPAFAPAPATTPAPEPDRVQEENALPAETETGSWFTPTRVGVLVASVPSVLSLILMVAVVADMTSTTGELSPSGLATGVFFDVIVAGLVAIAWFQPTVRKQAGYGAWVGAVAAAALIAWHYQGSVQMLFGSIPLLAKFTWHLTLVARTAAETRAAKANQAAAEKARREEEETERRQSKLSAELTEEQQAELAALERETAYVSAKTEKELALDAARAHADQQRALAEIRRRAEQQMTVDEASADIEVRRAELRNRIHLAAPLYTARELLAGESQKVPDDPSGFGVAPVGVAGFGVGLSEARAGGGGIGRQDGDIAADLRGRPSPAVRGGGIGRQGDDIAADQAERAPHHAARVAAGQDTRQRVLEEIRYAGVQVSNAELSRLLEIGRTTVRDHRNALREAGHHVYPDSE